MLAFLQNLHLTPDAALLALVISGNCLSGLIGFMGAIAIVVLGGRR